MKNLLYILYLVVITLILLEITLRFIVKENDDTVIFQNNILSYKKSYWQNKVDELIKPDPSNIHYGEYDPALGWSIGANKFGDSLYVSNSEGIRANREYTLEPDSGVFRIATFGDSFTHGYEVANNETWEVYLEKSLKDGGVNAEVINFGVGGFGMGQAYLRWLEMGKNYKPDLVIFGMQMENFWRTLNTCRAKYYRATGIILTKPRAYLDNGELKWANKPALKPEFMLDSVILDFDESKLYPYEEFKEKRMYYGNSWWSWSYTYLLGANFWEKAVTKYREATTRQISKHEEGKALTKQLIKSFYQDVEAQGAEFMIVKLPMREHSVYYREHNKVENYDYIQEVAAGHPVIYADSAFSASTDKENFLSVHYSGKGNKIVSDLLFRHLIDDLVKTNNK